MTYIPIKRGEYLLGDKWRGNDGKEWRICKIAESELGNVVKLRSGFKYLILSEYSTREFLKFKIAK